MTVKLFDTETQRAFREEVEAYERRSKELMEKGEPWPHEMRYPKTPEPMADSADPGQGVLSPYTISVPASPTPNGSDPRPSNFLPARDGTAQSEVEGFESQADKPFRLKR